MSHNSGTDKRRLFKLSGSSVLRWISNNGHQPVTAGVEAYMRTAMLLYLTFVAMATYAPNAKCQRVLLYSVYG